MTKRLFVLFGLVACLMPAVSSAADKLSVDAAIALMKDSQAMRSPARRSAAATAFRGLQGDQAQAAAEKLGGLLGKLAGQGPYALSGACQQLGAPVIPVLVKRIGDDVAWRDIQGIIPRMGDACAAPLLPLAGGDDAKLRSRAVTLLEGIAARSRRRADLAACVPVLVAVLDSPDDSLVRHALRALAYLGPQAPACVPAATAALARANAAVRQQAALTLGAVGAPACASAGRLLAVANDRAQPVLVRHAARGAWLAIVCPRGTTAADKINAAAEAILPGLADPEIGVAIRVAGDVAALGPNAVPALRKALATDAPQVKRLALLALARVGKAAAAAQPDIVRLLDAAAPDVRRAAVEAAGRIGLGALATEIAARLGDQDPVVRQAAADALALLDPKVAEVRKALAAWRAAEAARLAELRKPSVVRTAEKPGVKYLLGGPLAGVELPLMKGDNGEEPGYPGCIPELIEQAQNVTDMGNEYKKWGPQGQAPVWELYPGASELWRCYWFKYCPVRSFFDRQSLVKRWTAPDLPGVPRARVEQYRAPVTWVGRHADPMGQKTGKFWKPRAVVRFRVKAPVVQLALGTLAPGMYVVRVIGAIPTEKVRRFTEPQFMALTVDDGIDAQQNTYRVRFLAVDDFYSTAEIYFHAPEKREYHASLWLDQGSTVDLLVHTISLDDALAGIVVEPLKTKSTLSTQPTKRKPAHWLIEERLARDRAIWRTFPPINAQGTAPHTTAPASPAGSWGWPAKWGVPGKTPDEVKAEHGAFTVPGGPRSWRADAELDPLQGVAFLYDAHRGLVYSVEDMRAHKPLPTPFPCKDTGAGLYFPDPRNGDKGLIWDPIASRVGELRRDWLGRIHGGASAWLTSGDPDAAHDAALALIRFAYQLPSIDTEKTQLDNCTTIPGGAGRAALRKRLTAAMWLSHYALYDNFADPYDKLFDYIQGNELLARSVQRFIPWVRTSSDVVALLDAYLVQHTAKRVLRYHYYTDPMTPMKLAGVLGMSPVTRPWVDWVFNRTFMYPLPPSGVGNLMITGCDRSGTEYIGSSFYAGGEGASRNAAMVQRFLDMGIVPKEYDLTNAALYPKPLAHCYWTVERFVAGRDLIRIGDVNGPDKLIGRFITARDFRGKAELGWRWSKQPVFAWLLVHGGGRTDALADEWPVIEAAAKQLGRAPWLDLRSRHISNWAGVLEAGTEHDDYRFRRAVYLRVGAGIGHQHNDALDLQFVAHGEPMTMDGGQRPGYSTPGDRGARVHNGAGCGYRQSWVAALADIPQARYLRATAAVPYHAETYTERQIALVDVDEGRGGKPLTIDQQFSARGLPQDVVTPDSYIFDVYRVAGGNAHTYNFHGPLSKGFTTNARQLAAVALPAEGQEPTVDQAFLAAFGATQDSWRAGVAPDVLQATWANERGENLFTRMHLLGVGRQRVYVADSYCRPRDYRLKHVMIRNPGKEGENRQSVYVALFEPYVAAPFITGRALLPVGGNDADARRAVAVEVRTRNGHRDVCFADARPEKTRSVGDARVAAEYAFWSVDDKGLRLAALSGGTLLDTPLVRLAPALRELTGTVTGIDYMKKQMTIDRAWPAFATGVFEIGDPAQRLTSYTALAVEPAGAGSVITVKGGADYFRSSVTEVRPRAADGTTTVLTHIKPSLMDMVGLVKNWYITNDTRTKSWRGDFAGDHRWKLRGVASEEDFAPSGALRVWECGPGDGVRRSTAASLRRVGDGVFQLTVDVDLTVSLKGRTLQVSSDGRAWRAFKTTAEGGFVSAVIRTADLGPTGRVWLKVE